MQLAFKSKRLWLELEYPRSPQVEQGDSPPVDTMSPMTVFGFHVPTVEPSETMIVQSGGEYGPEYDKTE